ncbi:Insulinase (Peptidase M16) [Physocladia obscura]|uniref:Insulinase (Peptidase M16) n=1 Tax=Physocladia obscura TaxID=109957 RepID=A0AAD5TAC6_9FUNG|nr:Insulinase (Peptidase M16) [Physocladia obscura]
MASPPSASAVSLLNTPAFTDIRKPDLDDRQYALLTLANKLQVLIVSDPTTDKASAAMDVHVGHLSDPAVAPGLAHFCEHLLFMGNAKYPSENEYSQYLAAHGGSSNAFTAADHTNYYFDVKAEFFEGALDRFTQFFVSPLFDSSCTDREMKAVDSEHKKNLQSDAWRIYQLQKDLMDPSHPFCKFGTGNLHTLGVIPREHGLDVRETLLKFHDGFYSVTKISLTFLNTNNFLTLPLGKFNENESISQLSEWVVEQTSAIKNKDIPIPKFPGHPLSKNQLLQQIKIKPVKDMQSLNIVFPLPDLTSQYLCKPSGYISHLIGHESEGSILAHLKQRGWAQELTAGTSSGAIGFDFFRIGINLTEEGTRHWEEIVVLVFEYIEMLREGGIKDWIYEECKAISEMRFRFEEKRNPASFASHVAGEMHDYAPEHILCGSSIMFEMDKEKIQNLLNTLTVDNFRITLVSPDFNSLEWSKAEWYGTEYLHESISESLKIALASLRPTSHFHLPLKNEFIPDNFSIRKTKMKHQTRPDIVHVSDVIRVWHKKDDTFWQPKAKVAFTFKSPIAYVTPATCVLTRLYTDCLMDQLNEFSYYAHVCGLDYYMTNSTEGIELSISGYNDKLSHLLERILQLAKTLNIDEKRFSAIKEELGRSYKNWSMEQPYQHASFFASHVTQERLWTSSEKFAVLEDLTCADVAAFYPELLGRLHIEGFVFGNVEASEAILLGKSVQRFLGCKALPSIVHNQVVRTHILPKGTHTVVTRDIMNQNQVNSALEYLVQIGDVSDEYLRVHTMLFAQIVKEPCFNVLRTQEQLGYIVASGIRKQTGMISFRVLVQSEKGPKFIEDRVEGFLKSLKDILASMPAKELKKNAEAVAFNLLEKDKNLAQEASKHWARISSRYYDFEQDDRDAKKVLEISRESLLEFYDVYISPESHTRRILSVHMQSAKAGMDENVNVVDGAIKKRFMREEEVADLKLGLELGLCPVPVVPLSNFVVAGSKITLILSEMAVPKHSRLALTPQEVEFIAETQIITVIPTRSIPTEFDLLSGTYGPLRPPLKSKVPLWLALALKRRGKCNIEPPAWLDAEYLDLKLQDERSSEDFAELEFGWLETATMLMRDAQDDIPNFEEVQNFIKSIKECRENKAIKILKLISIDLYSQQGYLDIENIGRLEINEIKPFFTRAFDEMGKFSGLLTRDDGKGGAVPMSE